MKPSPARAWSYADQPCRVGDAMRERHDARFLAALETVLAHEGGHADDPDDPGGATNFGISLRWLRSLGELEGDLDGDGDVDGGDIRCLSREDAARFYYEHWWRPQGYGLFSSDAVATKVFDLAVNMGPRPAHQILQRAVRAACGEMLIDDGVIGPKTRQAVEACSGGLLSAAMRSEAAGSYRLIAASKPRLKKFLRGWLNRAYS